MELQCISTDCKFVLLGCRVIGSQAGTFFAVASNRNKPGDVTSGVQVMLQLYFEGLDVGVTHRLGELSETFYLAGKCLLGGDNVYRAFYDNGLWCIPHRNYIMLGVTPNVLVAFDDHAHDVNPLGPFGCIRIVGGSIWAGSLVLVRYDESADGWFEPGEEQCWPVILIQQLRGSGCRR